VARHRFLTSDHVTALLDASQKQVLRRLQVLFHHGYLTRPRAQLTYYEAGSRPMVYGLGKLGAETLAASMPLQSWPDAAADVKQLHLAHTLMVADITVGFEVACRDSEGTIWRPPESFLTPHGQTLAEPFKWQVNVPGTGTLGVIPDAVFGFDVNGSTPRFCILEADNGTMPVKRDNLRQTSLWRKLVCYRESWTQDVLQKRFRNRLHILIVTRGQDRVRHLLELIEKELGFARGLFFVTDLAEIKAAPNLLAARWHHAGGQFLTLT